MRHVGRLRWMILGACPALIVAVGSTIASAQDAGDRPGRLVQLLSPDSQIGISIRDAEPDKPEGALVTRVYSGTPADRAGAREGDIVVEFDRERVRSATQLTRLIRETPAGRTVPMVVLRDTRRMDLRITPEAGSSRSFQSPMPQFRDGPMQPPSNPRVIPDLPSSRRYDVPPDLQTPGLPGTPRLGIGVTELTPQLAEYFGTKDGVLISTVDDGSPASRAGLKAGDIIASIDGQPVVHSNDVSRVVRSKRLGDHVAVGIVRDHKSQTITVTLGDQRGGLKQ